MNTLLVEGLRQKLRKRVSRFGCADESDTFRGKLAQFWQFFDRQDMLLGIMEDLLARFPCSTMLSNAYMRGSSSSGPKLKRRRRPLDIVFFAALIRQSRALTN